MALVPRKYQVDRLGNKDKIVREDGTAEPFFIQQWNLMQSLVQQVANLSGVDIPTTAPILGGGNVETLQPISHAESGVTPGAYTNADITVDEFGHITLAANGSGGGGGAWELVASHDFAATPQATYSVNNLDYTDLWVVVDRVTAAASGLRLVRVSTDNGATFYNTSGNYIGEPSTGLPANLTAMGGHSVANAGARSVSVYIAGANLSGAPKFGISNEFHVLFVASNDPINAIQVSNTAAGNLTGGVVYVFGR